MHTCFTTDSHPIHTRCTPGGPSSSAGGRARGRVIRTWFAPALHLFPPNLHLIPATPRPHLGRRRPRRHPPRRQRRARRGPPDVDPVDAGPRKRLLDEAARAGPKGGQKWAVDWRSNGDRAGGVRAVDARAVSASSMRMRARPRRGSKTVVKLRPNGGHKRTRRRVRSSAGTERAAARFRSEAWGTGPFTPDLHLIYT